jgi:AraC-like DNA-binding protein
MEPIGLTRVSILTPIVSYLHEIAAPVEELLVTSGVPGSALMDPETLIPTTAAPRLLREAARTQGIGDVGVKAGETAELEGLGVFGRLIRRSRTLGDAVQAVVEYHRMFSSNCRMWLSDRGDQMELCQAFTNRIDDDWQQASHYMLMLMLGVLRLGAPPNWRPAEVRLQTGKCATLGNVERLSDVYLEFAQPSTAIVFPRAFLASPLASMVGDGVSDDLEAWQATAPLGDFVGSMLQVIETLSWEAYPDIRTTARALDMSVRTLQRRLAAGGCTHEGLIDRTRFATAASLLEETDAKILDLALALGYSDHAHFTRAFHRWAGCSPRAFRRAHATATSSFPRETPLGRGDSRTMERAAAAEANRGTRYAATQGK